MPRVSPQQAWENFRQRVAELGGVVLEPQYLGSGRRHRCICREGHACSPHPTHVQQGKGICPVCAGNDSDTARDAFYRQIAELGGTVLETEWRGTSRTYLCRCPIGHECRPRPDHVREGIGMCRACAGCDPVDAERNFRQRIAELGGTVLEPAWLGNHKAHRCTCPEGHACSPRPAHIQQGRGMCWTCAGKDPVVAEANFCRRVAELGGVVLEPAWLGNGTPHLVRCPNDHERRIAPSNIQQGRGLCQTCGWWDQDVLYVTRNPVTRCVKFGITARDGRNRLSVHRAAGYTEVLRLETGLPEGVAALAEQKIMAALAMVGAVPVQGREYFSDEYLALIFNEIDNWVSPVAAVA